jgi:3-oxoacyl-[acyl-carrier protein] reductase
MDLVAGEFESQNVFVAGASQGIGEGIALAFAREGASVFIGARGADRLAAAAQRIAAASGHKPQIVVGDFTATAGDLLTGLPPFDVLVVSYGATDTAPGFDTDDLSWKRLIDANLSGPAHLARHVGRTMAARGRGAILFIGSICGHEVLGAPIAYNVGKTGLRALTKTMARELGPKGVRVNLIDPGNVLFESGRWAQRLAANPEDVSAIIDRVPLRRFGTPADIAEAAVFLCSQRASFITGADLIVDGGQTAFV